MIPSSPNTVLLLDGPKNGNYVNTEGEVGDAIIYPEGYYVIDTWPEGERVGIWHTGSYVGDNQEAFPDDD